MRLSCEYNGNNLYSNHWNLCTVEEGFDDRIIFCPLRKGKKKYIKDLKIPNFLPKVSPHRPLYLSLKRVKCLINATMIYTDCLQTIVCLINNIEN